MIDHLLKDTDLMEPDKIRRAIRHGLCDRLNAIMLIWHPGILAQKKKFTRETQTRPGSIKDFHRNNERKMTGMEPYGRQPACYYVLVRLVLSCFCEHAG